MPRTSSSLLKSSSLRLILISIAVVSYLALPGQGLRWLLPSGSAQTTATKTKDGTSSAATSPGAISFSASNYSVNEGDGAANITLTRTGGTDNKVVAKVSLTDVTTSPSDHGLTPGTVDTVFNQAPGFTSATGTDNVVSSISVQPDGKIILGGAFTFCRAVARNHIARLNADGTLDTTFDPGTGTDGAVGTAVQSDGKIIIYGGFRRYNDSPQKFVARLNSDGSLDPTFKLSSVVNNPASAVLQADGKILVSGNFSDTSFAQLRIVRLNPDGTLDNTFNSGTGGNDFVGVGAVRPDGKIVISGPFTTYNGIARNHLARLNPDGSLDTTFNPVVGATENFTAIVLQPDGKFILGGDFTDVNGIHGVIRRINSDGSTDPSFNPGTGANLSVYTAALQQDGKIIIGGNFTTYNGTPRIRIARLNLDGSLDTTFLPNLGADNPILAMRLQDDGRIVIGGEFSDYNNAYRSHIARIEGDIFITWPAGDASNKTVQLPIADDSILEPTESLTLSLTPIAGGATIGTNATATLSIIDNDTRLSSVSGSGIYNGTAILTATLSSFSSNLSGKTITFTRFGGPIGTATTDSNGVATLTGVSISGIRAGTYATGIGASFAGETNFSSSSNTGPLTVSKATPVITWNNPANIVVGTPLSNTQLNAIADVAGTFAYTPSAGTVLNVGSNQLSVTFTPTDTGNYTTASKSVQLTVDPVPPPTVQLSAMSYSVNEGDGFAIITVNRSGDLSAPATFKYATSDSTDVNFKCDPTTAGQVTGIASRKCDYHIAVGRLRFAAGESTKQIAVSIVDDVYIEGPETFNLTLSNPTGATLGTNSRATITITDNDNGGAANPIDGTSFYVRQLYVDLLSREPDPAGWAGWIHRIDFCGQPGEAPPPCDRVTVGGDGFLRSAEFFDRQFFVLRLYRTGLGRIPIYDEVSDLAYVSGFLSSSDLELNKQELVADIMSRSEFGNKYNGLTNLGFVDALLATAGVTVDATTHDGWVTALTTSSKTRAQVYREISERPEVSTKYLHEAQVISAYYGFFTRNPDGAYLNFLQRLDNGEINLGDLANAFINAAEYRQRFGQ
jgi:uncharacterized delta-60 repeat protein